MKMFAVVAFVTCLASSLISLSFASDTPTDMEMHDAAESWLRGNIELHGRWGDDDPVDVPVAIASTRSLVSGDTLLASAYLISSGGMIIVPRTKRLPPVLAFSTRGDWSDIDADDPCNHTLGAVKGAVIRALRREPVGATDDGWSPPSRDKTNFPTGTIIGAGPLMSGIDWSQCGDPWNGGCPSAGTCEHRCSNDRSALGCVASSVSRLLRYHAYPDSGTGTSSYGWDGDSTCAGSIGDTLSVSHSHPIDWDMLPESCSGGCDSAQISSLASFCYRVAVGVHMDFGHISSGAELVDARPLLTDHLGYRCGTDVNWSPTGNSSFDLLREEVNACRPVEAGLEQGGAHAACVDGWAIDNGNRRWLSINNDGGAAWWAEPTWTLNQLLPGVRPLGTVDSVLVLADGVHTIQGAIDTVSAGCSIYLADGTYAGPGNRDIDFGGKGVTVRSLSDNPEACIIDCGGSPQSPHRGFDFHHDEGGNAVVRGVTVTNGYVSGAGGGAILCRGPLLCTNPSTPLFINCVFRGNEADYGGAVAATQCSRPRLEGCVLAENTAGQGSAFYASSPYSSLKNCTIAANTCQTSTQGAICADGQYLLLDRCIVANTTVGVSTSCVNGGQALYSCSDIWGNRGGTGEWVFRGSCIASQASANSNLHVDPLFCADDYRLNWSSPCLNNCGGAIGARAEWCDWWYVPGDFQTIRDAISHMTATSPKNIILTASLYESQTTDDENQNLEIIWDDVTIRSQSGDPSSCRIVLSVPSAAHRFAWVTQGHSLELEGVTVEDGEYNEMGDPGGTVRVSGAATLRNCVITNSDSNDGGAFAVDVGGRLKLVGCRIESCRSETGGAGAVYGALEADSTLFWANVGDNPFHAGAYAGGLYVTGRADIDQCTFVANTGGSRVRASAMYVDGEESEASIRRSIIAFGKPVIPAVGGCLSGGEVIASCTDVFGNGQNWAGCLNGQDAVDSLNNITLEPGFCDTSAGDFHSDSLYICCSDCGQIGAYDSVCVMNKKLDRPRLGTFLGIVGRNPASAPTLRFWVGPEARDALVDVSVYDVAGRRVRRLYAGLGGDLPQTVVWDGAGDSGQRVASGVYFARLSVAGGSAKAQRVVVLR